MSQIFICGYAKKHMSKNNDRYKEDYSNVDIEELDEIETEKFQKFRPKKKKNKKSSHKDIQRDDE